jgi:4-hydroxythreonine-4-phosphate dehydrogenase
MSSARRVPWLLVAADDRTGALEVAGACADAGTGPVAVQVHGSSAPIGDVSAVGAGVVVVDLASRHLAPGDAAERATGPASRPTVRRAHKIDSLLRGNWASEVAAHAGASGRVLVVAAFPAVGRTCIGGAVHVDGLLLDALDARHASRSPRPADHLADAGFADVAHLAPAEVRGWLAGRGRAAVCDAAGDDDLAAIGAAWAASSGVLLAGTAGAIAAGARAAACHDGIASAAAAPVALDPPVVVVCGSLHPGARAQLDELARSGAAMTVLDADGTGAPDSGGADVHVLTSAVPGALPVDAAAADRVAELLADAARRAIARLGARTVVVIGGDTAAAVLGDGPVVVGGTVAPGAPWSLGAPVDGPLGAVVVTRAGGFGGPRALVELLGLASALTPSTSSAGAHRS